MGMIDQARASMGARPQPGPPQRLSLALQGGGSFGAFTAGVLDRLLEREIAFDAVSGASAGAVNAVLMASGLIESREAARAKLARFWKRMSQSASFLPAASLAAAAMNVGFGALTRTLSPAQFNPFDLNPLREALAAEIDFAELRARSPVKLLIAATRVRDGQLKIFRESEASVETVLASACLPLVHRTVEIDGEPYWDGGYAANPPLIPLVQASDAPQVLVVQVTPAKSERLPATPAEILKRLDRDPFQRDAQRRTRGAEDRARAARDPETAPPAHRPDRGAGRIRRPRGRERGQSRLGLPRTPARERPQRDRRLDRRDDGMSGAGPSARRRLLARPTDRAGARRRSLRATGVRDRRSVGRPEAVRGACRPWRARRRAPRCAPRPGAGG